MSFTREGAVDFLLKNAGRRSRDINSSDLKLAVQELQEAAVSGLSSQHIVTLSNKVIFRSAYDVVTRRKLLFSLMPEGHDFPYQIIPLAVSSITVIPMSPAWQGAVLTWIGGLLEYGIISSHNRYLHLCYTAVFNLASHMNLCALACKVLYYLTVREDVTRKHTQSLLRLKLKPGFYTHASQLLRLYSLFRPDLVVGQLAQKRISPSSPANLKRVLLAARVRLQEIDESTVLQDFNYIWHDRKAEKVNPHQRKTAIPQPITILYTDKLEEKKRKVIFVTQYRRFPELVRGIEDCKSWQWPNNPVANLSNPIIIPLFRPHEKHVLVGITNWLEFALRTEVLDGIGNPSKERCEKLLDASYDLVRATGTPIPVINHFVTELMTKWNEKAHFQKVLALLEAVSFTSPEFISETLLKFVARLITTAPLFTWCRIVEALTNTACSWAVVAQQETNTDYLDWPQQAITESSIVGLWFLTHRLERFFIIALVDFNYHPMIVNQVLDYYTKVNMYAEVLELPIVFFPPTTFTLAVLAMSDLGSTHRLGKLLSSMQTAMQRVKSMKTVGPKEAIREECLSMAENINQALIFFMSGIYTSKALTSKWEKVLDPFYPFHFLKNILKRENAQSFASITQAFAYLPFFAKFLADSEEEWSSVQKEVRDKVLDELQEAGLTGIGECVKAYMKQ